MTHPGHATRPDPRGAPPGTAAASDHRPPRLLPAEAVRIARELFGIEADATPLPSERDQNFLLRRAAGDAFVLKISQTGEDPGIVACQNEVLERLAGAGSTTTPGARASAITPADRPGFRFPRPQPSRAGRTIESIRADDGAEHLVRVLDYLPGVPLARVRPHPPALLEEVGRLLGTVDRALDGYAHPAVDRALRWDLRRGRAVVAEHLDAVADPGRRALVERFVAQFDEAAAPLLADLRTGVIHGDGNDWNILVSEIDDPLAPRAVVGILDFGDIVRSWLVAEPAIGAAYAMLGKVDPLAAAAHLVRGYHRTLPLLEPEIEALFPLICLRLCTSVVLAAHQRRLDPANDYLSVSETPAWTLLERLATVHPRLAHARLRDACDLPACARSATVTRWLEANPDRIGPVLDPDPREAERIVFDLGVGSLELDGLRGRDDAAAWTEVLFGRMRERGATVGIGRYDEPRRWNTAEVFGVETDDGEEWRSIHIGIDLFVPPDTPVLAPLDGTVHCVRHNEGRFDYGPTVVLRHEVADDVVFHTLYGHLAPDALALEPGRPVRRGEPIARVGDFPGNGDWAPHLHLQLVVDPLDRAGEFPGVARPSERAVWLSFSPDPNLLLRIPELRSGGGVRGTGSAVSGDRDGDGEPVGDEGDTGRDGGAMAGGARGSRDGRSAPAMSIDEILAARRRLVGPNLSLSYRRPLHIVRGWMQHLYDADGQAYLDCVNNVAHIGHAHPRVVEALTRQSAVLNTNTRYLHENLVRYAERLAATLPAPLSVCFFVCSGSEANELALRLARTHTARRDVVVLDAAYHGNTGALVDLSPYKFDGPGGRGAPPTTHVVPLPDPYRGPYRGAGRETGRRYADHVRETVAWLEREGRGVAALLVESLPGCGGQIVLPDGFLADAFRHVRAAGGVCIADEVQVGFGRVGSRFWGFETHDVVPDIVTMGKPIGNGHPLGAVVTTPEIAASFANGMEYFNTFGGNPVSCAVGLAVLEVIEAEGLQARALAVGERLAAGLRGLIDRHPLIGDVRGLGLYLGVELVLDRETLAPAPRHAAYVVERMRDHGILLSTDGPLHNVIKIKPPLQFSAADADRVVETMDRVLGEDGGRVGW